MTARPRWLWPAAFAGLTIALVAIALARGSVTLDPATPEGVVQEYLRAVAADDYDAAFELVDPELIEDCGPADTRQADWIGAFTATLPHAAEPPVGERALVDVTIRVSEGPLLPSWVREEAFALIARDGVWWITDDPWPHFWWDCGPGGFPPGGFPPGLPPEEFWPDDFWPDDFDRDDFDQDDSRRGDF